MRLFGAKEPVIPVKDLAPHSSAAGELLDAQLYDCASRERDELRRKLDVVRQRQNLKMR